MRVGPAGRVAVRAVGYPANMNTTPNEPVKDPDIDLGTHAGEDPDAPVPEVAPEQPPTDPGEDPVVDPPPDVAETDPETESGL